MIWSWHMTKLARLSGMGRPPPAAAICVGRGPIPGQLRLFQKGSNYLPELEWATETREILDQNGFL